MKYRKKPVIIEAEQCFLPDKEGKACIPDGVYLYQPPDNYIGSKTPGVEGTRIPQKTYYAIDTLEGRHEVSNGDWIITGVKGEKYPCKPDIFEMTYEKVDERTP